MNIFKKGPTLITMLQVLDKVAAYDTVSSGTATTTRYWDCSGGACGCAFGDSNSPVHCHTNAMFTAPAGNDYGASHYGTTAVS